MRASANVTKNGMKLTVTESASTRKPNITDSNKRSFLLMVVDANAVERTICTFSPSITSRNLFHRSINIRTADVSQVRHFYDYLRKKITRTLVEFCVGTVTVHTPTMGSVHTNRMTNFNVGINEL